MHARDVTERPPHHRDLERFNDHGGGRPRPPGEDAGLRPGHFLGPADRHREALPAGG